MNKPRDRKVLLKKMDVLLYARSRGQLGKKLLKAVEKVMSTQRINRYRTFDTLSRRLHQPRNGLEIAVMLAQDSEELANLATLRDVLSGFRIILIVPDDKKDTVSTAHTLHPRFLTYADGNFKEVQMVLAKMIESLESKNNFITQGRKK